MSRTREIESGRTTATAKSIKKNVEKVFKRTFPHNCHKYSTNIDHYEISLHQFVLMPIFEPWQDCCTSTKKEVDTANITDERQIDRIFT